MADIYADLDFPERVRTLISVDNSMFSDTMIKSFDFKGSAELSVKKSVPTWQNILDGEETTKKDLLKSCVVFKTAILLAPNAKKEQVKVQQTTHAKVEYFDSTAWNELIDSLAERLSAMYLELNGEDYNGFSLVALTNENNRYYGSGFDVL